MTKRELIDQLSAMSDDALITVVTGIRDDDGDPGDFSAPIADVEFVTAGALQYLFVALPQ